MDTGTRIRSLPWWRRLCCFVMIYYCFLKASKPCFHSKMYKFCDDVMLIRAYILGFQKDLLNPLPSWASILNEDSS